MRKTRVVEAMAQSSRPSFPRQLPTEPILRRFNDANPESGATLAIVARTRARKCRMSLWIALQSSGDVILYGWLGPWGRTRTCAPRFPSPMTGSRRRSTGTRRLSACGRVEKRSRAARTQRRREMRIVLQRLRSRAARATRHTCQPVTFRWKTLYSPQWVISADLGQVHARSAKRKSLQRRWLREWAIQDLNL